MQVAERAYEARVAVLGHRLLKVRFLLLKMTLVVVVSSHPRARRAQMNATLLKAREDVCAARAA